MSGKDGEIRDREIWEVREGCRERAKELGKGSNKVKGIDGGRQRSM